MLWRGKITGGLVAWSFLAILVSSWVVGTDGFYERGSNVISLKDQKQFKEQVLNSNFLWVVEFYREGCGYCQLLTPEWEKVAENLKHMVHIGAVDTERHRDLAANHADPSNPIQGVPTIKLYIPTKKKGKPEVVIYQGERKASAIISFITARMPSYVQLLKEKDGSHERFLNDTSKPKVVYLTDKSSTPTVFKALSAEYKDRVIIGEVRKSEWGVFAMYGPDALPTLLQMVQNEEGKIAAMFAYDFTKTNGKSFTKISNFIWDAERDWKKLKKKAAEKKKEGGGGGEEKKTKGGRGEL